MRLLRAYSKKAESALAERFQQIVDEKLHLATSIMDLDPTLKKMYSKYYPDSSFKDSKEDEFNQLYQKEIAYVKSEKLLRTKEARDLADTITNPAWNGNERLLDTAKRMIVDSVPRAKPLTKTIITPPVPMRERLTNARESSLDYKVAKRKTQEEQEAENFRELYKERLLGPSMFVDATSSKATMGLIGTMADARINAEIDQKTGKFETPGMENVRGKPLDRQRLANSTDTNFFVNEILNNQDCLPPWIESQQGIEREMQAFRLDMQQKWFNLIIGRMVAQHGSRKSEILKHIDTNKSSYANEFARSHGAYISAKIADLNNGIRNYNLQSPSGSFHKWKMIESNEIDRLFSGVVQNIHNLVEQWFEKQNTVRRLQVKKSGAGDSMLDLFGSVRGGSAGSGSAYTVVERPVEKLDIWNLVKLLFRQ